MHIFRENAVKALHENRPPTKTHILHLPTNPSENIDDYTESDAIRSVFFGGQETCVLTSAGRVFTCQTSATSSLRLEALPTEAQSQLGVVRAACVTRTGGFAMICSLDAVALVAHVMPAAFVELRTTGNVIAMDHTYDISFEPNALQSTWLTSRFAVKDLWPAVGQRSAARSQEFFQLLRGIPNETFSPEQSCLFVAIDNQLLALIETPADAKADRTDDIQPCMLLLVHTCVTEIRNFWLAVAGDAVFILLASGRMDVLYVSDVLGDAILQRCSIAFGDLVGCSAAMRDDDDVFVYASEAEVVQVKLTRHSQCDRFVAEQQSRQAIAIHGVLAMAFFADARSILTLVENQFVYAMPWTSVDQISLDMKQALHKVDNGFIQRGHQQLAKIVRMTEECQHIRRQIAELKSQQQVILLARNAIDCRDATKTEAPFRARLTASKWPPTTALSASTIYAGDGVGKSLIVDRNSFFIHIKVELAVGVTLKDLQRWQLTDGHNLWTLHIRETNPVRSKSSVRTFRLIGDMFALDSHPQSEPPSIDILINTSCPPDALFLPEFTMELQTFVRVGSDAQLISFDVPCQRRLDVAQLISVHCGERPPFSYAELLFDQQRGEHVAAKSTELVYRSRLPMGVSWSDVLAMFGWAKPWPTEPHGMAAYVCMLERWVRMSYEMVGIGEAENGRLLLSLASTDAGALYEAKMCLLTRLLDEHSYDGRLAEDVNAEILVSVVDERVKWNMVMIYYLV